MWERNPFNFALGATTVGFLLGLIVPVTRLETEKIPAAVDAVRSSLEGAGGGSSTGNGNSNGSNGKTMESAIS
jgi:hypothetical protein